MLSDNPYIKRVNAQTKTSHGRLSETRIAKKLGARLQPNSGAMRGAKSDAILKRANFRLEMKSTTHLTLPLQLAWLSKISTEALSHSQRPGVVISFVDRQGR